MLIRDYYTIDSVEAFKGGATFRVTLDPSCGIYAGHFPSRPISPGVCNIRMVTECAELYLGMLLQDSNNAAQKSHSPLRITEIHRCRFTKLITPADTPHLIIRLNLTETAADDSPADNCQSYKLKAEIVDGETVCLTLDCSLIDD